MEVNASLVNFAAGVLSKKFLGRVDLPSFYKAGLLTCRNFFPQAQGPAEYRQGSQYILHTRLNRDAMLYPFVFNDEQAYALEFTDKKMRVFSGGEVTYAAAGATARQFLSHFNGLDGATAYTAETGQVVTFYGGAELDTAQKKFGASSLLLDGVDSYVDVPSNADLSFGAGDLTFDCQVRFSNTAGVQTIFSHGRPINHYGALYWDGTATKWGYYWTDPAVTLLSAADATIVADTWYHIALVRKGNVWTLYRDGVAQASGTFNVNLSDTNFVIGYNTRLATNYFKGWIDDVSFVQGEAVWSTGFTPPSAEYSTTNTKVITAVTQANPGVVTISSHGYASGDEIYISGVQGMTELNNKYYLVVYIDGDTFSLTDIDAAAIDTTAYTAYTTGGLAEEVYEIATPYAEADLKSLQFAQKADLMYIVHPDYAPRKLIRAGEATWTLSTYLRTADPFAKVITGITAANPGVVTATAHGFVNGDIIQIEDVVGMTEVNLNTYKVANKADNTFQLTDATTGANVDTSGFTAYSSAGVVFKAGNMPGAVGFYGGRLAFGGTDGEPESFWMSKAPTNAGVTQYDNFTVGSSAGDAVTFPISSQNNTADRIQWFSGTNKFLGIGTFGGVYKANGGSDTTPISGTAVAVQALDFVGCKYLQPVRMGSALFYVQRGSLILNKFAFSLLADDFRTASLNIFSDEITQNGMKQLAIQQGTTDFIWAVTETGELLGMTVKTEEEVSAWHGPHTFGGTDVKILSVCGEPQSDNKDSLWVVVERTINGVTRRYIEYIEAEDYLPEPEDYYIGTSETVENDMYERELYEAAKHLVRLDSSLTLTNSQTVSLTPGAVSGTGVTFTALSDVFAATDVGRYIVKRSKTGVETGKALITAYTSATVVTCTVTEAFDSVSAMASGDWYLTVTSLTGLDHLEGETVRLQLDGEDGGEKTVASGAISFTTPTTVVHVGLSYKGRITTMPLDIGAMVGNSQAKTTTVNRLGLLIRHSLGIKFGTDLYNLETMEEGYFNGKPILETDALFLNLPDGYDRRKFIHIIQDAPYPCTIQGIIPYVDTTNE